MVVAGEGEGGENGGEGGVIQAKLESFVLYRHEAMAVNRLGDLRLCSRDSRHEGLQ